MNPEPPTEQQPDYEAIARMIGYPVEFDILRPNRDVAAGHLLRALRSNPAALAKFLEGTDWCPPKEIRTKDLLNWVEEVMNPILKEKNKEINDLKAELQSQEIDIEEMQKAFLQDSESTKQKDARIRELEKVGSLLRYNGGPLLGGDYGQYHVACIKYDALIKNYRGEGKNEI